MVLSYDAANIEVLEGLEAVRKRPAMYILRGAESPSRGLARFLLEPFCLAIDGGTGGPASHVAMSFEPRGVVRVMNDGPGIPTETMPGSDLSAVEFIMTKMHAGCRDQKRDPKNMAWCRSGIFAITALSRTCAVRVRRGGRTWQQRYADWKTLTPLRKIARTAKTGTEVFFTLDRSLVAMPFELSELEAEIEQFREWFPCIDVSLHAPAQMLRWWQRPPR
jgi:DNA gyrase subunit B